MKSTFITGLALGLVGCVAGFAASAHAEVTDWDETIRIFSQRDAYTTVICQKTNHAGICEIARNTRTDKQATKKLFLECLGEDDEACETYENLVEVNREIVAELQPVAKVFRATEQDDDFSYGPTKQDDKADFSYGPRKPSNNDSSHSPKWGNDDMASQGRSRTTRQAPQRGPLSDPSVSSDTTSTMDMLNRTMQRAQGVADGKYSMEEMKEMNACGAQMTGFLEGMATQGGIMNSIRKGENALRTREEASRVIRETDRVLNQQPDLD